MKSVRALSLASTCCLVFSSAAALLTSANRSAWAQFPPPPGGAPQCSEFPKLIEEAQKRGASVGVAIKGKVGRKEICALMTTFVAAEGKVIKFLQDNKTWCGIPDQAVAAARANHEKSLKFRTAACEEGPKPRAPTLSDAIKGPSLDTAKNTKTGRGTFDTLTGNPLAK
jgi:hypothetical protein